MQWGFCVRSCGSVCNNPPLHTNCHTIRVLQLQLESKAAAPRRKSCARGVGGGDGCMCPPGLRPVRGDEVLRLARWRGGTTKISGVDFLKRRQQQQTGEAQRGCPGPRGAYRDSGLPGCCKQFGYHAARRKCSDVLVEPQRSIAASPRVCASRVTLLHTQSIRPAPSPQHAIGAVEADNALAYFAN